MIDAKSQLDIQVRRERLELELRKVIAKRDRAYTVVESGDDTGHTLILALGDIKRVELRIKQLLIAERDRAENKQSGIALHFESRTPKASTFQIEP